MASKSSFDLVQAAARIFCEDQLTDYRIAKQKAAQSLGFSARTAMPDNAAVQAAVLDYQRLFGGAIYVERLRNLRETAVKAMKLLAGFQPRLVGAVVSGAVTHAHRIQLHAFSEKAESLEMFLHNHGVRCEQADRNYHYPDGHEQESPLICFEIGDVGVDVAMFGEVEIQRPPLNPADGRAFKRLDLVAVERLART